MEEAFFDSISSFYDDMIGFDAAVSRRTESLRKFIEPAMEYAADAGCGTGIDSISLFQLGLKVRAFDISAGMIEEAEKNIKQAGAKVKFYNTSISGIPRSFDNSFDLAVSLGNTLANIPAGEISFSIQRLYEILTPGGRLLLQILNYEKLKKSNERIINITNKDNNYFIRFYDFFENYINFNILKFDSTDTGKRSLNTTPLYPYSADELNGILQKNNFRKIELFGSLKMDAFDQAKSPDVIISAYK